MPLDRGFHLRIPVADAEGEAVELVSPDQLGLAVAGERDRDARHLEPAQGVLERQVGEPRIAHRRHAATSRGRDGVRGMSGA